MKANNHLVFVLVFQILCFKLCESTVQQIHFDQPIQISISLGQHFSANLPQYFTTHQDITLHSFTHQNQQFPQQQSPNFQILPHSNSTILPTNTIYHYGLSDPEGYFAGNKKIYKFSDLKKLIGVLDVVVFRGEVIVLFESGFYSFFQVVKNEGKVEGESKVESGNVLVLKQTKRLLSNVENYTQSEQIKYSMAALNFWGDLIFSEDQEKLLFFGQEKAFLFNTEKRAFQLMSGYDPKQGALLEKAIIVGNQIICASGQKGVTIYEIDYLNKAMKFKLSFKPAMKRQYSNRGLSEVIITQLQPIDLVYDKSRKRLIIADDNEGIFWMKVPESSSQSYVVCQQPNVNLQRCDHLQILQSRHLLLALCPQPHLINLQTRKPLLTNLPPLAFTPSYLLLVNETKVFLFGQKMYALYDIHLNAMESSGISENGIDYAVVVGEEIVSVDEFGVSLNVVTEERDGFYVGTDVGRDAKFVGVSRVEVVYEGFCESLMGSNKVVPENCRIYQRQASIYGESPLLLASPQDLTKLSTFQPSPTNTTQPSVCHIYQTLSITIVDQSNPSHQTQIIIGSFIGVILFIGLGFFWHQNRLIYKEYNSVVEEKKNVHIEDKIQSACHLDQKAKNQL